MLGVPGIVIEDWVKTVDEEGYCKEGKISEDYKFFLHINIISNYPLFP